MWASYSKAPLCTSSGRGAAPPPSVLGLPVPDADERPPLQGGSEVEGPAGDPVGRGVERKLEGKEPFHNPGPPCRRVMQPGGTALPLYYV